MLLHLVQVRGSAPYLITLQGAQPLAKGYITIPRAKGPGDWFGNINTGQGPLDRAEPIPKGSSYIFSG